MCILNNAKRHKQLATEVKLNLQKNIDEFYTKINIYQCIQIFQIKFI